MAHRARFVNSTVYSACTTPPPNTYG
jgi:hypothetical protein